MKTLIIVYSFHHKNTEKVAHVMARVLNADVRSPKETTDEEISRYDLVGFGAGIDSGKHYRPILALSKKLQTVRRRQAFIFSTAGVSSQDKMRKDHSILRENLVSKGFEIKDEFQCLGFNTNSFLKYFGGINRNCPNERDLERAAEFARCVGRGQGRWRKENSCTNEM